MFVFLLSLTITPPKHSPSLMLLNAYNIFNNSPFLYYLPPMLIFFFLECFLPGPGRFSVLILMPDSPLGYTIKMDLSWIFTGNKMV